MPLRSDAARNAEKLLAAARELFAMEGTDVPLDRIAQLAGVGNATLYRNFPTRSDLLIAVHSREIEALTHLGQTLLDSDDPDEALFAWLLALTRHMVDKRSLATAAVDGRADLRGELFTRWHAQMLSTLDALRARAQAAGAIGDESTADLAALANGVALTSTDAAQAMRLLLVVRHGLEPTAVA